MFQQQYTRVFKSLNPMLFPFLCNHEVRFRASNLTFFFKFSSFSGSNNQHRHVVLDTSQSWFVKVVSTLFYFQPNSLDLHLHFLARNLNPLIAFQVVRRLDNHYCKNPILALKFFEFSRINICLIHTFGTYNYILRSLCHMNLYDSVNLVVDWMLVDGHSLKGSVFGFLVGSVLDSGRFDSALKLLERVKCGEMEENPFVYNMFLNGFVRHNRVDEAVTFFRNKMVSKSLVDVCSFNILIRGLCKAREVDKAYKLFMEMVNFGSNPDVITYNTMINGLCRANKVGEARELLSEIRSKVDVFPDVVTFTSIIAGYCKLNMMDEASSLFQEMINSGIRPSLITFNVLIDGFSKVGDIASMTSIYEKMLYLGCLPDVITFTSRIDGYCRMGKVDDALKLLHEMVNRKVSPNNYTFSILIIALCKENRLDEACDFLRQLKLRNDIILQPFMYNPILDGLCKAGKVDEANLILLEIEEKNCKHDKYTFTILIIGHCMKGRMVEAIKIFNRMLLVKCTPDDITVKSLLSCLVKAGMPNEASMIEKQITLGKVELDLSSSLRNFPARRNMDIEVAV